MVEHEKIVTLTGPPGVGKSTTAEMLLLSMWHDGWTVVDVTSSIEEAWKLLRHPIRKQVFYYDDFLGQTSAAELAKNESASITNFIEAIRRGDGSRRLVMTTRDQVLSQARNGSDDRLRRMPIDSSRVRVQVSEMTRMQRAHLLFNHFHFSLNDPRDRKHAADNLRQNTNIIDHPNFSPRIIESATMRSNVADYTELYAKLKYSLENPEELWAGSFASLSLLATAILNQLVMLPGGETRVDILHNAVGRPESRAWHESLRVLEGTWIRLTAISSWNPAGTASLFDGSRRDFLLRRLEDKATLDEILDQACWIEQIAYLTRLGGLSSSFTPAPHSQFTKLRDNLSSSSSQISSAARRVIDAEIDSRAPRSYTEGKKGSTLYRQQSRSRLVTILSSGAMVLRSCRAKFQTEWFHRRLDEFLSSIPADGSHVADAMNLMDLAEEYSSLMGTTWDFRIEEIALAAAASLETAEELARYEQLTDGYPDMRPKAPVVRQVIYGEIDGASQQDDPETVSQWIVDIDNLGDRYNIAVDLDSLHELEERLREQERELPDRINSIAQMADDDSNQGNIASENAEISALFARLSSSDGPNAHG
jgi:hypothetical protein